MERVTGRSPRASRLPTQLVRERLAPRRALNRGTVQAAGVVMGLIGLVFFWLAYHLLGQVRGMDLVLMHRKLLPLE